MNENTDLLQPRSASSGDGDTHGSSGEPVAPMPHLALALSLRFALILLMGVCLHLAGQSLLWIDLGIIAVDAITLAMLAHLMKGEGRRLRDLYVPTGGADIAWGLLFSVIIIVGFFVSNILANLIVYHGFPPTQSSNFVPPLWLGALAFAVMPLTVAFAEEGCIVPTFCLVLRVAWARSRHCSSCLSSLGSSISGLLFLTGSRCCPGP